MADQRRINPRELEKKARENMAQFGLAPGPLARELRPGAVFIVKDEAISFPEARLPKAGPPTVHTGRFVIVVSEIALARSRAPCTLLVVPCTGSKADAASSWHFEVPADEPAFTAERVIAYAEQVQPILKSDILKFVGNLRPTTLTALLAAVAKNLGIIAPDSIALPPRPAGVSEPPAGRLPDE